MSEQVPSEEMHEMQRKTHSIKWNRALAERMMEAIDVQLLIMQRISREAFTTSVNIPATDDTIHAADAFSERSKHEA